MLECIQTSFINTMGIAHGQQTSFSSIDEYIATFPEAIQTLLEAVRSIHQETAAPRAQKKVVIECRHFF